MISAISSRERGLIHPLVLNRAETTRRIHSVELSKFKIVEEDVHSDSGAGTVNCLDIDRVENRYLLSGGSHGTIAIHDLENLSGKVDHTYKNVTGVARATSSRKGLEAVQWFPLDTGIFTSSCCDGSLTVWNTNYMVPAETFNMKDIIYTHHMSPVATKHSLIAVGTQDRAVRLLDTRKGSATHTLIGHKQSILTVKWSSSDEYILASGGLDSKVMLWDIRSTKGCLMALDKENGKKISLGSATAHAGAVNGMCFTNDGLFLVTFGKDHTVRLWDARTGKNTLINFGKVNNASQKCVNICVSEGGSSDVVCVPSFNNIEMLDLQQGLPVATLQGHYNQVCCCVYQPNTQQFFSGGADHNILVWGPAVDEAAYEDHLREEETSRDQPKERSFTSRVAADADAWSGEDDD